MDIIFGAIILFIAFALLAVFFYLILQLFNLVNALFRQIYLGIAKLTTIKKDE